MSATSYYLDLLTALGEQVRSDPKDLGAAVSVVGDVGRLLVRGNEEEIRSVQAAVAAIRERLDGHDAMPSPVKELTSPQAHVFLAGALWALNEVGNIRLASGVEAPSAPAGVSRRSAVRDAVRDLLSETPTSPSELRDAAARQRFEVRPDELSRALGALCEAGLAREAPGPAGADRRRKYYVRQPRRSGDRRV